MKAFVCLLMIPAALAVWILGSPRTAWRVIAAFRRTGPEGRRPEGAGYIALRVGATLALVSIVVILILLAQRPD
ncbi:MAG: hypothetical protein ACRDT6_06505 [Micromonosporaceae bacterium]